VPRLLDVRLAGEEDLSAVLAILTDASGWERSHGIEDPWPFPFPADRVAPGLSRREVFLAYSESEAPIATVSLSWEDPRFWGERPPDAGYVHRLAVRPDHLGRGIGRTLLEWASERIHDSGRQFLRLDCLARNDRLCRYYRDAGFEARGTVVVDGFECARFERPTRASGSPQR
jgi:protein-tyrosine phosphatase